MTAAIDNALTPNGSVHEQLLKAFENTVSDLDAFFKKKMQEALEHADDINRIAQMMSDAESKRQYAQEIMSAMVLDIDFDLARDLSAYTQQDHQNAKDKLFSMHRNHLLPQLKVPMSCIGTLQWCLIDTFAVEQYRYHDIVKIEPGEIFIDCGACFGDTAVWAYQKGAKQVYCFEPSQSNLEMIKANLIDNQFPTTGLIPYAVSDQAKTVEFADFEDTSIGCSCIVDEGMNRATFTQANAKFIEIECVKLDDYCAEHDIKPTFIKMDIEGAEYDALIGAKQIIQEYKPKLAICLYHSLEDMWRIPLLIKQFVPEYRFYCRKNNFCNEFVMYAIC